MSNELNFNELNPELLDCQKLLKPEQPQKITAKNTLDILKRVGLSEDGIMPGGLRDYVAEILRIQGLAPSTYNLEEALQAPEVQITLKSAIEYASKVYYSENTVNTEVANLTKNIVGMDPESTALVKNLVKEELQNNLKEEAKESVQAPVAETTPVKEEVELPKVEAPRAHFCPKCGWDTTIGYTPIYYTEADKEQFLYCLLGGTPFKKEFSVLGGKMTISFKSLTAAEEDAVFTQLRKDVKAERFTDVTMLNYAQLEYETALALIALDTEGSLPKLQYTDFDGDEPLRAYCEYLSNTYIKTAMRKRLMNEAHTIFRQIYVELMNEVTSENFYQPAKSAG